MQIVTKMDVHDSKSIVVTQRIAIPESDRVIIITQYSDKNDERVSLTLITMTGLDYSIIMFGDVFVKTIAYIGETFDLANSGDMKNMDPERMWEGYVAQYLYHEHKGQKRFYDTM